MAGDTTMPSARYSTILRMNPACRSHDSLLLQSRTDLPVLASVSSNAGSKASKNGSLTLLTMTPTACGPGLSPVSVAPRTFLRSVRADPVLTSEIQVTFRLTPSAGDGFFVDASSPPLTRRKTGFANVVAPQAPDNYARSEKCGNAIRQDTISTWPIQTPLLRTGPPAFIWNVAVRSHETGPSFHQCLLVEPESRRTTSCPTNTIDAPWASQSASADPKWRSIESIAKCFDPSCVEGFRLHQTWSNSAAIKSCVYINVKHSHTIVFLCLCCDDDDYSLLIQT